MTRNFLMLLSIVLCLGVGGSWTEASGKKSIGERLKGLMETDVRPVQTELVAEHTSIPAGGTTRVGVLFHIQEGWHIYAKEPGDAGLPTKIAWFGPWGATFGPLVWPKPQAFIDPGDIKTFGYTGAAVLSSDLSLSSTVKATVRVKARVKWLACKEACVPGSAELELTLPVSGAAPALSTHANFFEHTGKRE